MDNLFTITTDGLGNLHLMVEGGGEFPFATEKVADESPAAHYAAMVKLVQTFIAAQS